jgi:hypothetical protein
MMLADANFWPNSSHFSLSPSLSSLLFFGYDPNPPRCYIGAINHCTVSHLSSCFSSIFLCGSGSYVLRYSSFLSTSCLRPPSVRCTRGGHLALLRASTACGSGILVLLWHCFCTQVLFAMTDYCFSWLACFLQIIVDALPISSPSSDRPGFEVPHDAGWYQRGKHLTRHA